MSEKAEVKVQDWLKDMMVWYTRLEHHNDTPFASKASLRLDGYVISLPTQYYASLAEATEGISMRVKEAVMNFKIVDDLPVQLKAEVGPIVIGKAKEG